MLFLMFLALTVGAMMSVQAGINSELKRYLGNPIYASLVSATVAVLSLLIYSIVMRMPFPTWVAISKVPISNWLGGFCGAMYLVVVIMVAPKLGVSITMGLIITGQMLMAITLDHFGLIGFPVHPANLWRIVGAILLIVGVILIRKF
ncbi:MAG: DMT family transporter [Nitrospira sp.]|nr:DMT family transporter [Nitrospira sp.]